MTTKKKRFFTFLAHLSLLSIVVPGTASSAPQSDALFAKLASLVGKWEGSKDGNRVTVSYRLIANGTVLTEEFRVAESTPMTTMFSVYGDRLRATHHCSAGNQPQMASSPILAGPSSSLQFALVRVTGLRSVGDFDNTGLVLTLDDADHLTQRWSYDESCKPGISVFHFHRVAP